VDPLSPDEVLAEVVTPCGRLRFRVRLEDGRVIVVAVPKRVARVMYRIVSGQRVRVTASQTATPRIVGFAAER
jgi:translation initiation factor IF-1